jgi:hypothetical protein
MVLENGKMIYSGSAKEAVDYYTFNEKEKLNLTNNLKWNIDDAPGNEDIKVLEIQISSLKGDVLSIGSGIKIEYLFLNNKENINLGTTIEILGINDELLVHQGIGITSNRDSKSGIYKASYSIEPYTLNANEYKINLIFGENRNYLLLKLENILCFEIASEFEEGLNKKLPGLLYLNLEPKTEYLGKK